MERLTSVPSDQNEASSPKKRFLVGEAAGQLEERWRFQRSLGRAGAFLDELTTAIETDQDKLPRLFTTLNPSINNRRQPSFVEAILETVKRLRVLDDLIANAPESVRGIIVGGSMSYGKFYNIRGAPDPSDIDLFYVVDPSFFNQEEAQNAFNPKLGIDPAQAERFYKRVAHFPNLFDKQEAELMSEKFEVKDFVISVKILPLTTFRDEFDNGLASATGENGNQLKPILDYKHEMYPTTSFTQYNFLGEPCVLAVNQAKQADGSAIAGIPYITVSNGHLYTGDHHNHVFPKYEILLDRHGDIHQTMQTFQDRLRQRLKQERAYFQRKDLSVLNAHDRQRVFSPQVLSEARRRFA